MQKGVRTHVNPKNKRVQDIDENDCDQKRYYCSVRTKDCHLVTPLAAARHAFCIQSTAQVASVSASSVDDDS